MASPAGSDGRRSRDRVAMESLALKSAASALRRVDTCWKNLAHEEDIEAVHRLRTGTNHLRSLLKLAGPLCGWPQTGETEAVLKRWQKSWGPVRDLDVLILHLTDWSKSMDPQARNSAERVLAIFRQRRATLYTRAFKEIGKKKGKQARETLDSMKRWVRQRRHALPGKKSDPAARKSFAAASISLLWPTVLTGWQTRKRKAEKNFHGEDLHKFRLANKRLRHVLQLYKSIARPGWLELLALVDDLHETIGDLHDTEVLIGEVETLAARWAKNGTSRSRVIPRQVLYLLTHLDVRRREKFGHALELWYRLNQPETKSLLLDPLKPRKAVTPSPRGPKTSPSKSKTPNARAASPSPKP